MIIDLILDRQDDIETFNELYNPKTFYNDVLEYADMFGSDNAENIAFKIAKAMDEGTEEEVRQQLCSYIKDYGYNDDICNFINSVEWLKPHSNYKQREKSLYEILLNETLSKKEMAEEAVLLIEQNIKERETLIQLYEMARDARKNCPYPDVQYNIEQYADKALTLCCSRIQALFLY
jgi:hypothetical protein